MSLDGIPVDAVMLVFVMYLGCKLGLTGTLSVDDTHRLTHIFSSSMAVYL